MNWYKRIPPVQTSFFRDQPHGRCSFNFQLCHFHLPGFRKTGKLKCIDLNFTKSGTRTCLAQMFEARIPKLDFWRTRFRFLEWLNGSGLRWEEKNMFQSQPNRHIPSRSKKFCNCGAKMWRFSGKMWQKTSQVKKKIVCESVTFFPEMWQMWRVTFFVTEKSDECKVTQPNLRREAEEKSA